VLCHNLCVLISEHVLELPASDPLTPMLKQEIADYRIDIDPFTSHDTVSRHVVVE
jgi:hypothetical protein